MSREKKRNCVDPNGGAKSESKVEVRFVLHALPRAVFALVHKVVHCAVFVARQGLAVFTGAMDPLTKKKKRTGRNLPRSVDGQKLQQEGSELRWSIEQLRHSTVLRSLYLELKYHVFESGSKKKGAADNSEDDDDDNLPIAAMTGSGSAIDVGSDIEPNCYKKRKPKGQLEEADGEWCRRKIDTILQPPVEKGWSSDTTKKGVETVGIKKKWCCRAAKANSKPTNCACRYLMFKYNGYLQMTLVLKQIHYLRQQIQRDSNAEATREAFHSVFGVTNISTFGGSLGTRGLFYYFHSLREAGSLCSNAMYVVLTQPLWSILVDTVIADEFRRAKVKCGPVVGGWQLGKHTVESYNKLDVLLGYSKYVQMRQAVDAIPSKLELVRCAANSGLHHQPTAPGKMNVRKSTNDIKAFLEQYEFGWEANQGRRVHDLLLFCNPFKQGGVLFPLLGNSATCMQDGVRHRHSCDVFCFELRNTVVVDRLLKLFLIWYGPDGSFHDSKRSLKESVVGYGCWSWGADAADASLAGVFDILGVRNLIDEIVHRVALSQDEGYRSLVLSPLLKHGIPKVAGEHIARAATVVENSTIRVKFSLCINKHPVSGKRRETPYYVVPSEMLAATGCMFRAVVGLERSGLLLRMWPHGTQNDTKGKLVFVPPGVALVFPTTVAVADIIRFAPGGHKRIEFTIHLDQMNNQSQWISVEDGGFVQHAVVHECNVDYSLEEIKRFAQEFKF